jgi:hypothetical protein
MLLDYYIRRAIAESYLAFQTVQSQLVANTIVDGLGIAQMVQDFGASTIKTQESLCASKIVKDTQGGKVLKVWVSFNSLTSHSNWHCWRHCVSCKRLFTSTGKAGGWCNCWIGNLNWRSIERKLLIILLFSLYVSLYSSTIYMILIISYSLQETTCPRAAPQADPPISVTLQHSFQIR